MYEIGTFTVYKFTVYCIVYSKLLLQVTDQSVSYYTFALLTASLFFNQSESYCTFVLLLSQSMSYYTFLHYLHVQEKHFCNIIILAFIALLLMGLTMDCDIVIWLQSLYKSRK